MTHLRIQKICPNTEDLVAFYKEEARIRIVTELTNLLFSGDCYIVRLTDSETTFITKNGTEYIKYTIECEVNSRVEQDIKHKLNVKDTIANLLNYAKSAIQPPTITTVIDKTGNNDAHS